MKNFPHQINQLPRLKEALGVFARLIETNQDGDNDGVVGDALAREGIYAFRKPGSRTVEELLRSEHKKSYGSQGTRTCARDLRRFFELLGYLQRQNQRLEVSPSGKAVLALTSEDQNEALKDVWRQALLNLELEESKNVSHPYQILLRLIAELPGLDRLYAGLALEARDDSDAEFERICRLARNPNPRDVMNAVAGSKSKADDAIKILPSLAKQLGDVPQIGGQLYISDFVADVFAGEGEHAASKKAVRKLIRRPFAPRRRSTEGARRTAAGRSVVRIYDPDQVGARFNAHEDCLDRLSKLFGAGVEKLAHDYDLLLVIPETSLLVEAKTIREDAPRQIRAALAQLFYYEYFDILPLFPDTEILRLTLTDCQVGEDLQKFLTRHQIGLVWILESGKVGGTELGLAHLRKLGAKV